jgi:hypothetical protein
VPLLFREARIKVFSLRFGVIVDTPTTGNLHFSSSSNWITAFPGGIEFTQGADTCLLSS